MTDRRVKDLSYGRLGKPIYDAQLGWTFSQNTNLEHRIQRVLPLKEELPPSIFAPQNRQKTPQHQFQKISKKIPDLHPAEALAKEFAGSNHELDLESKGPLFSVGKALDRGRLSGPSTFTIFAMPYGEAGHILRIVRPKIERRGWEKKSSVTIPLFHAESCDQAYYNIGSGGPIQQITFSNEEGGSGTWLAVRQITVTTILQIHYSEDEDRFSKTSGLSALKATNMMPSAVVTFPAVHSQAQNHADVAFNPLYNRQIAVVDLSGRWSIWDNEPRHSKKSSPRLVYRKSGQILDDYEFNPNLSIPEHSLTDGWHRIFWVCNLTTILVCSRTHLAIFDIKANSVRLDSTEFLIAKDIEIILDIKRSAQHLDHVYVLTSSRIYWIKVVPSREGVNRSEPMGCVKVLLSYRHFRNENDDTMHLAIMQDKFLSVSICSGSNHMIQFYSFSINKGEEGSGQRQRQSAQGFFYLSGNDDALLEKWDKSPKMILLLPIPLENRLNNDSDGGLGAIYIESGIRFFQPFILTTDFGVSSTVCAASLQPGFQSLIEPPMAKISRSFRRLGYRRPVEGFIVHGEESDFEEDLPLLLNRRRSPQPSAFLMNWTQIFESVFLENSDDENTEKAKSFLPTVIRRLQHALKEDQMTPGTLLEMSSFTKLSENLEEVTEALQDFFKLWPEDSENLSDLVIANASGCPGVDLPLDGDLKPEDLMKIYQDLVEKWITSLPREVSMAVRGSKFRMIRQIAVELYFSLIVISLQNKSSKVSSILLENEDGYLGDAGTTTRESTPATFYSAQISLGASQDPQTSLPGPTTRTLSTYSQLTTASNVEGDPAITRLRQYAVSIKPRRDIEKPKILSEWPAVPGVDPATYVYKAPVDFDDEDSAPESARNRRQMAQRKKQTENFLQRSLESSRPRRAVVPFGSQPVEAPEPPFSSQPTEYALTQPDRGRFGSRKAKGKKKQRTAGF